MLQKIWNIAMNFIQVSQFFSEPYLKATIVTFSIYSYFIILIKSDIPYVHTDAKIIINILLLYITLMNITPRKYRI